MLRTFCSNPGLGGFGNESTIYNKSNSHSVVTPDAFCQIIKELVDNAIDACTVGVVKARNSSTDKIKSSTKLVTGKRNVDCAVAAVATAKRVRVVIERYMERKDSSEYADHNKELLKVTVSDNGCGMNDIQKCVGAFSTTKAGFDKETDAKHEMSDRVQPTEQQTAGRYGIGLTLCLLHAQRLVPDACASIQSATTTDNEWTVVSVVVDTASDTVRCLPRKSLPKSTPTESGTAVSLLVPGGPGASLAWPRLAEYFARFTFSLDMTCSLEVLAPTLSRVPLWVHPNDGIIPGSTSTNDYPKKNGNVRSGKKVTSDEDKENEVTINSTWTNPHRGDSAFHTTMNEKNVNRERMQIWKATETFLGRSIDFANVAYASVPIRIENDVSSKKILTNNSVAGPRLVVAVVVHGRSSDEEYGMDAGSSNMHERQVSKSCMDDPSNADTMPSKSASMVLIRMVNKIPLLDSAEAAACGLIYAVASKKRMWNSFGLEVNMNINPGNVNAIPTFDVRDSDQVMPFFNQGTHNLLECDTDSESDGETNPTSIGAKRKRNRIRVHRRLLPASLRLGNILLIVQIHAEPATLPLPTLCKGRLPIGNKAIDDALELGITKCLQQLQKTNPTILLTAAELRKAECDARYVPALALALATILSNSTNDTDETRIGQVHGWNESDSTLSRHCHKVGSVALTTDRTPMLSMLIEQRLRLVMLQSTKCRSFSKENNPKGNEKADSQADSEDEFCNGDILTNLKSDMNELLVQEDTKHALDDDCNFDEWL